MRYELVIFDWDGTLMDSVQKIVACMQATAAELEMAVPSEQAVRQIIGLSMEKALAILFPKLGQSRYQRTIAVYRQHYIELNTTPTPLFDGSKQLLHSLQAQGYQLAVATGKARAGLERVFSVSDLGSFFSASRCADESQSKPAPQMILEILQQLGVAAERAVMVGDSIHDLAMANNAGVDGIGVSYGAHDTQTLLQTNPKHIIDHPLQLLDCLK